MPLKDPAARKAYDKQYAANPKRKAAMKTHCKRYVASAKGKMAKARYDATAKGVFATARKRLNECMRAHTTRLEELLCAVESSKS